MGEKLTRNFQPRIDDCKNPLEQLKNRTDNYGVFTYAEVQRKYLNLLSQQNTYWKQGAKTFWLKGGDINFGFFHKAVKRRRRNNSISKLINEEGRWVEKGPELC